MGIARMLPELVVSLFHRPATIKCPVEKVPAPPGLRGRPTCNYDLCIGCRACARDCPAEAIEMVPQGEKRQKPLFHYDRCAFCGQCADSCPKKAITMTGEYELSCCVRSSLVSENRSPENEVADD